MKRLAGLLLLFIVVAVSATAQTVTVIRNVNLRPEPSSWEDALALLKPPTVLTLLEPDEEDGYFKVRTADGKEGWVWSRNVRVEPPDVTGGPATAVPELPVCRGSGAVHARWVMKTRPQPKATPSGGPEPGGAEDDRSP